jgi:hypothetical protein
MSFEAPVQPVPVRRDRVVVVLVALVAAGALLVWMPWSAPPRDRLGAVGGSSPRATASPARSEVAAVTPTAVPSPTPYGHPEGLPLVEFGPLLGAPTLDRFVPRWSVVGVTDTGKRDLEITQIPTVATFGLVEGHTADGVCRVATFGSSFVAVLPAGTLLMIGIVAPAGTITSATELTRYDGAALSAYELRVRPPAGGVARADARLFVREDLLHWGGGLYRFHTEAPDGTSEFTYACLLPPSLLDGTDRGLPGV